MKQSFSIIGGDKRNINLKYLLEEDGHTVNAYGFSKYKEDKIENCISLKEAVVSAKYVIVGTPFTLDNNLIMSPFSYTDIKVEELVSLVNKNQVLIGGSFNKEIIEILNKQEIMFVDILDYEEMTLLNAIPTAEGVIKIAIQETDFTITGSKVMIIGYGRIGKVLTKMFNGIGAEVFVIVNTLSAKAQAEGLGYKAIMYQDINICLSNMDVIINTVPSPVLTKNNLIYIKETSLIVDISSPPFGINYDESKNYGVKVLWARALPGQIAPKSVAIYIRDTIYTIIDS